jgi:hypothetical protein
MVQEKTPWRGGGALHHSKRHFEASQKILKKPQKVAPKCQTIFFAHCKHILERQNSPQQQRTPETANNSSRLDYWDPLMMMSCGGSIRWVNPPLAPWSGRVLHFSGLRRNGEVHSVSSFYCHSMALVVRGGVEKVYLGIPRLE